MRTDVVRTTAFELSHTDVIEQFLIDVYGTPMRVRSDGGQPLLRHQRHDAGVFALETAYQSADLRFQVEPLNQIIVTRTTTSRLERACAGVHRRYDVGELFIMSDPERPYTARWMPGEIQNCILAPGLLARVAATAPSRRPEPIRFTSLDPRSPAAAARWWTTRTYIAGLLSDPEAVAAPLVLSSAANLLAAVTLATFPNTALRDPALEDRRDGSNATLRRAIAYIDAHPAADITIASIAAAAHASIRSVQVAFRRHLGTTPMSYLRRVRLSHAHVDLRNANPISSTVTAIGARWGFASSSRFIALYRQAYGITPAQTLREG